MHRNKLIKTLIWAVLLSIIVMIIASKSLFNLNNQDNDFRVSSDNEIVKVVLSEQGKERLLLERQRDGFWTLNQSSRVNEISVRDLLETLNLLTTRQPVPRAIEEEVNKNLDYEGISVSVFVKKPLINIFNAVKAIPLRRLAKRFVIGHDAPNNQGSYIRLKGSKNPYLVHIPGSDIPLREFFNTEKVYWLDPVVVDLKSAQIMKIEIINLFPDKESLVIENQNNEWLLTANQEIVGNDKISHLSLLRFLDSFGELYYEKLLVGPDSIAHQEKMVKPMFMQMFITDKSGTTTTLDFYRKETEENLIDPDRFFLVVNGRELAIARYFVFNRLIRPISFFLN